MKSLKQISAILIVTIMSILLAAIVNPQGSVSPDSFHYPISVSGRSNFATTLVRVDYGSWQADFAPAQPGQTITLSSPLSFQGTYFSRWFDANNNIDFLEQWEQDGLAFVTFIMPYGDVVVFSLGHEIPFIKSFWDRIPAGHAGQPFEYMLQAIYIPDGSIWEIVFLDLPPGLNLDPITGIISGIPYAAGVFGFATRVSYNYTQIAHSFITQIVIEPGEYHFARASIYPHAGTIWIVTTGMDFQISSIYARVGNNVQIAVGDPFDEFSHWEIVYGNTELSDPWFSEDGFWRVDFLMPDGELYIRAIFDAIPRITTERIPDGRMGESYFATFRATQVPYGSSWHIREIGDGYNFPYWLAVSSYFINHLDAWITAHGFPTSSGFFEFYFDISHDGQIIASRRFSMTIHPQEMRRATIFGRYLWYSDIFVEERDSRYALNSIFAMPGEIVTVSTIAYNFSHWTPPTNISEWVYDGRLYVTFIMPERDLSIYALFYGDPRIGYIFTDSIPSGIAGRYFSFQLMGNHDDLYWEAPSGLPDGLSLDSATGIISGMPTTGGIFDLFIFARPGDDGGARGLPLSITIHDYPAIAITPIGDREISPEIGSEVWFRVDIANMPQNERFYFVMDGGQSGTGLSVGGLPSGIGISGYVDIDADGEGFGYLILTVVGNIGADFSFAGVRFFR